MKEIKVAAVQLDTNQSPSIDSSDVYQVLKHADILLLLSARNSGG